MINLRIRMYPEPQITHFINEEERLLVAAIESDEYQIGENRLTPERLDVLQRSAKATVNPERVRISLARTCYGFIFVEGSSSEIRHALPNLD